MGTWTARVISQDRVKSNSTVDRGVRPVEPVIRSRRSRQLIASAMRIALVLLLIIGLVWAFGIKMPGRNLSMAAVLDASEIALRAELIADVQALAGEIGERNMNRYPQLLAAADFIEASLTGAGFTPRRDSYELRGRACHNIEVEIRGMSQEIFVI